MPALAAPVVAADPPLSSPLPAKTKMPAMIAITATIAMTGPQRRQGLLVLDGASPLLGCMQSTFLVALTCRNPQLRNARWRRWWCRGRTPRPAGAASTSVGSPGRDDGPLIHRDHPVGDRPEKRHVVLDDDEARAHLVADAQQQRAQRLGLALGDAARRLVEQEHRRAGGRARTRGRRSRRVPVDSSRTNLFGGCVEPEQLDELATRAATCRSESYAAAGAARRRAGRGPRPTARTRPRSSPRRSATGRARRPGTSGRGRARLARPGPIDVTLRPFEQHRAAVGPQVARDEVEQRGLAGAVRADDADDLARVRPRC